MESNLASRMNDMVSMHVSRTANRFYYIYMPLVVLHDPLVRRGDVTCTEKC